MRGGGNQGRRWVPGGVAALVARAAVVALVVTAGSTVGAAAVEPQPAQGVPARRQLDAACDALRSAAVRGPYGWGWANTIPTQDEALADSSPGAGPGSAKAKRPARRERNAPAPDIDLRVTAAAGLVLQLAGETLGNETNTAAAVQAARAIASVQLPTGQVPATARLVPKPAGHAEGAAGIVPDRGPTCAGLGLMLVVLESTKDQPDPRIRTAATRAATWLARQQTGSGGWQTAYPPGPGPKARRLIRLDGPGYRDSTFALLLAVRVLPRQEYTFAADRTVDQLLRLRVAELASPGKGLWGPAYTLGGEPVNDIAELPRGVDLLATRYAMETLLGAQLATNKPALATELAVATRAIGLLPQQEGQWRRRYDLFPPEQPPADAPAAAEVAGEPDVAPDLDETKKVVEPFDSLALARLITAVKLAKTGGGQERTAAEEREIGLGLPDRLAASVCGLSDQTLLVEIPVDEKPSPDVPEAVSNAWTLLLKAKLEPKPPARERK